MLISQGIVQPWLLEEVQPIVDRAEKSEHKSEDE
jgi:hypothetical protein